MTDWNRGNDDDTYQGSGVHRADPRHAATDPANAARQEQVKEDHDALQESARRVESSVPADVRDTPVQQANLRTPEAENARPARDTPRENAVAAREGVREESDRDRDRR
jgi:hypothetical protein